MSIPPTRYSRPVLYLSYDGLSDHIGQSQVMPYLRACRAGGVPFHLVTFEKKKNAEKIRQIGATLAAEGLHWHRLQFTEGRGMHRKLYDFIRFVCTALFVAVRYHCGVIHCRSYFASSIGLLIKRLTGKKLIFDKRDFWIDANVEHGRINLKRRSHRMIHGVLRSFERGLFRSAEVVISLTHTAKQMVLDRYPRRGPDSIVVIPCCVDLGLFDPKKIPAADTAALKRQLGLEGATVCGYVGSIGTAYMIPELLECFRVIRSRIPDAKLLFMVNNDRDEVVGHASAKGIPDECLVVHSAPREQMPLFISVIDYGVFFITPTFAKKATSPTKQYEMLAMNKSIITNTGVGDAERVFAELACGYLVRDFNDAEYAQAAGWMAANPARSTPYDLSHYSLEWGAARYLQVYQSLLGQ